MKNIHAVPATLSLLATFAMVGFAWGHSPRHAHVVQGRGATPIPAVEGASAISDNWEAHFVRHDAPWTAPVVKRVAVSAPHVDGRTCDPMGPEGRCFVRDLESEEGAQVLVCECP